ncbi:MAG: hypothetical protein VX487_01160 [Actinomycetota bacterium]|jgi:hypothetical protein|nr:hypothetical protein [Acidimicrobiaceae bacterium]MEC7175309.1 hypothetical protein [Actinomycetota bacterium]MEC7434576.1 hypothetical protein [Actinomycetota bacterium]MEC7580761.1 hypothetical protein [Actinomycetota bacterium]MEC7665633.1 hypothetical protein [Actinomycetota bacterium]
MRKLSRFAWLVIAVQIFFVVIMIAIYSGGDSCVAEESIEGLVAEVICDTADELIALMLFMTALFFWAMSNLVLGIVAVRRRKKKDSSSVS